MSVIFVPQPKHGNTKIGPPPVCRVCGELIPQDGDDPNNCWLKRVVCRPAHDKKEVKCITKWHQTTHSKSKPEERDHVHQPPRSHDKKPVARPQMSERSKEMLEQKQTRLNIEIDNSLAMRRSSLSPQLRRLWLERNGVAL